MSDQEINIAIAQACGKYDENTPLYCSRCRGCVPKADCYPVSEEVSTLIHHYCQGLVHIDVPNYCNDLNAMHEAEKALTRQEVYFNNLFCLLPYDENHGPFGDDGLDIMTPSSFTQIHATARQRAEAFLRTLNRWIETPTEGKSV